MTSLHPEVRQASVHDGRSLSRCQLTCWREAYAGIVPAEILAGLTADLDARARRWCEILAGEPRRTWVAVVDDEIVGFASGGPARDEDLPHLPELYALYVRASWYGTGLADRLTEPVLGSAPALLWVAELNARAQRYYSRLGFRRDGCTRTDDRFGGIRVLRMVRLASRTDGSPVQN